MRRDSTKTSILEAAIRLAMTHGYNRISREQIAAHAGCVPSVVSYHFGTMCKLRRAILGEAKRLHIEPILEQSQAALHGRGRK